MTRFTSPCLATLTALVLSLATLPAAAQSSMTPAQCEAMLMVGTQNYAASAVAGCTAYFQALAQNAASPGVFSASTSSAVMVMPMTSLSGG